MDPIEAATLDGLTTLLSGLLPAPAAPLVETALSVVPLRFSSPGLGNYIGPHENPLGSVFGCRVQAQVLILVSANDAVGLDNAVTSVTRAVLGADRNTLRRQGLLTLALKDLGLRLLAEPAAPDQTARREIALVALYEYAQLPTTAEGTIGQIPVKLTISAGTVAPSSAHGPVNGQGVPITETVSG